MDTVIEPGSPLNEGLQISESDPLHLDLDDDELLRVLKQKINDSEKLLKKRNIKERQENNRNFLFGAQHEDEPEEKPGEHKYTENVIYRNWRTIKPIALSRIPDVIVRENPKNKQSKEAADVLSKVLSTRLKKQDIRDVLGMAFKHRPVYLFGVLKHRWDPEKGDNGDYVIEWVHPQNMIIDSKAVTSDVQQHEFAGEWITLTVKDVLMKFPKKKNELLKALGWTVEDIEKPKELKLATQIKIAEVWFDWYKQETNPLNGQLEFTPDQGVVWAYFGNQNMVLDKMKNPNWDWQGEKKFFVYNEELDESRFRQALLQQQEIIGLQERTVYHNFLKNPQKPYFLMTYDQWGESPIDITSEIEQAIPLQKHYNLRGEHITAMAERAAKILNIWSTEGGFDASKIQEMYAKAKGLITDVIVDGEIDKSHRAVISPGPDGAQFNNQQQLSLAIDGIMGTNAPLRGELQSDVATTNQIAREGNISIIDDLVEDTINKAVKWAAENAMQYIRLRYIKEHFVDVVGPEGNMAYEVVNQDFIEDGMAIEIDSSATDKLERKREAFELARLKMVDPKNFFMDIGKSDPIGRAKALMLLQLAPNLYYQQELEKRNTNGMIANLDPRQVIDRAQQISGAIRSGVVTQLPPDQQQAIMQEAQQLQQQIQQIQQSPQGNVSQPTSMGGQI